MPPKQEKYFLGVDIGSTKSHALIADQTGRAVGFGSSGGGNWEGVGWDVAQKALQTCVRMAVRSARINISKIAGAGFGIAGYDWPEDLAGVQQMVNSLGLTAPCKIVNDAIVGLLAGAEAGWGVVVVSGTGTNCRGRDRLGREGRVTGMGSKYAEHGGAFELVNKAIQAVALAWTRRGPETKLNHTFLTLTGACSTEELLAGIARCRYKITPNAAHLIFQTAREGDLVAEEIIRWTARELADLAVGVIRQLEFENIAFDVVLAGSTFKGSMILNNVMEKRIKLVASQAKLVRLAVSPVIGSVLLGFEQSGMDTLDVRQTLIETSGQSGMVIDNE
jgi:N-acetylglucosamine kinase-like BadF-type ATPase